LTDRTLGTGKIASSTNVNALTVTSGAGVGLGNTNVNVIRPATQYTEASQGYAATTTPILNNDAVTGAPLPTTFVLRKGGTTDLSTFTIDATNNSLVGLKDKINSEAAANNLGVSASIVFNGTQQQLILTSTQTGTAERIQLVETPPVPEAQTALALNTLNAGVTPGDYSVLDASLTVNNLPITRSSNTISDVVPGLTLNIKGAGSSTVQVINNTGPFTDKVSNFVDAYNAVQDFVAAQYKAGEDGRPGGALVGDPTLRSVQQQLRGALQAVSADNGGAFRNLTDVGFGRDDAGKITFDKAIFDQKLTSSFNDVQALFSGQTTSQKGLANSILALTETLSDSVSGSVASAIKGFTTSIANIDKSLADYNYRLDALRESLTRQFAEVDAAINQMNGQGKSLTSIIDSLKPRD
jgi:flagellar hook-associated protein 2